MKLTHARAWGTLEGLEEEQVAVQFFKNSFSELNILRFLLNFLSISFRGRGSKQYKGREDDKEVASLFFLLFPTYSMKDMQAI